MTSPALNAIRDRFLAQVEQAAQELEAQVAGDLINSLAYQQGRADERARIVAHLTTWRDSVPSDRSLAATRNALTTILHAIQR